MSIIQVDTKPNKLHLYRLLCKKSFFYRTCRSSILILLSKLKLSFMKIPVNFVTLNISKNNSNGRPYYTVFLVFFSARVYKPIAKNNSRIEQNLHNNIHKMILTLLFAIWHTIEKKLLWNLLFFFLRIFLIMELFFKLIVLKPSHCLNPTLCIENAEQQDIRPKFEG